MSYIEGNQVTKTNFSANGQQLAMNVAGLNSFRVEFSGTYTFTAAFESSSNSTNGVDGVWFPLLATQTDASTQSLSHSTANTTRAYEASCHNDSWVRVRLTAFTSAGTHRVAIVGSTAAIEPAPSIVFPTTQAVSTPTGTPIAVTTTASTNASIQKASPGNLFEITVSNPTATPAYVKLYNKASAPTVGTDVPIMTITAPAAAATNKPTDTVLTFSQIGKRFATGIAMAVTAAPAATDTAVAVAGVQIHGTYI